MRQPNGHNRVLAAGLAALLICTAFHAQAASDPIKVLVLGGTSQTIENSFYDTIPLAAFFGETYTNPLNSGDPEILGCRVRYHVTGEWEKALKTIKDYRVVVIWDVPRQLTRDGEKVDVLPDAWLDQLETFVKDGGGLVVHGGVACYGTGNYLGASSSTNKEAADHLVYTGWQGSKLADLLPVTMPESYSLETQTGFRPATAGRDYSVAEYGPAEHPLVKGLPWDKRPPTAAHFLKAKPEATVMLIGRFGKNKEERPLVAGWTVGKGRVLAAAFSGVAMAHQMRGFSKQVFWDYDPVFWCRAVKWVAGRDDAGAGPVEENIRKRFARKCLTFEGEKALPEWLREEYPLSVRILEADGPNPEVQSLIFKIFKDFGFQYLSTCHYGPDQQKITAESAEKVDVLLVQSINPCSEPSHAKLKPEECSQILNTGEISTSYYGGPGPCPRNPKFLELATKACREHANAFGDNLRIHSYMLDDEYGWDMGYVVDKGIACYCLSCKEYYKKQTGGEAPLSVFHEPGYIAPLDDPWMKWVRTIRMNAFDPYQAAMGKILKRQAPWVKVTGYPGGYFGGLDLINDEYYLEYWAISELTACQRSDIRLATVEDMRGAKHELWGMLALLRQFEQDIRSGVSQETLRLTTGCMLGSGVDGIHLWASPWITKSPGEFGQEALWPEVEALAQKTRVFGNLFRALTRADAPVWMMGGWLHCSPHDAYTLVPAPTPEERKVDPEWQWGQYFAEDVAYPALMRAGVQVHAITSRQLMSEELFTRKAVFLPRLWFAEQEWLDRLQKYISGGGKVFVDQSCKVDIPGSVKLPVDIDAYRRDVVAGKRKLKNYAGFRASWDNRERHVATAMSVFRDQIGPVVPEPVTTDSDRCCFSLMEQGDAKYLFIYNQDKYAPHQFRVKVNLPAGVVYDLGVDRAADPIPGKLLSAKNTIDTGEMPAGGWKVYVLAPQVLKAVEATAKMNGDILAAEVTATGADGNVLNAAVPLRLEVTLKDGSHYIFFRTTQNGKASIAIPFHDRAKDVVGVTLTDLMSGQQATIKL